MTNIVSAIHDDYHDYATFCRYNGKKPVDEHSGENFYRTPEWKEVEQIPHLRGCLDSSRIFEHRQKNSLESKTI